MNFDWEVGFLQVSLCEPGKLVVMAAETSFAMHARMSMGNAARDAVAASLPPPALPGQRLISFLKAN